MAFRSASSFTPAYAGSAAGTLPAGTLASDILVALIGGSWPGGGQKPVVPPAGWNVIDLDPATGTTGYGGAFWAPGNVASLTFGTSVSSVDWELHLLAFSGRNTTTPIAGSGSHILVHDALGAAAAPVGNVTANAGDDIIICVIDSQTNVVFGAPPSGYTDRADTAGTGERMTTATRDNVSAGLTSGLSRTTSNGYADRVMFTIALAAAGASLPAFPCASSIRPKNNNYNRRLSGLRS